MRIPVALAVSRCVTALLGPMARLHATRIPGLVLCGGLLLAIPAGAAPTEAEPIQGRTAAEVLFRKGRDLMKVGKLDEGCRLLEESNRQEAAVGTLFSLGQCNQRRGRLASAWHTGRAAAALAREQHDDRRLAAAVRTARGVESKVGTILLRPSGAAKAVEGLTIQVDGQLVPQAIWGVGLPVDAGPHRLLLTAPRRQAIALTVTTADAVPTEVTLPELPPTSATRPPASPNPKVEQRAPTPSTGAPEDSALPLAEGGDQRILGLAIGGVGVLSLGIGAGLALDGKSKYDQATCNSGGTCTESGLRTRSNAIDQESIATVLGGVGLAAFLGGALVWLIAPAASGGTTAGRAQGIDTWSLNPAPGAWGLAARGRF